MKLKLLCTYCGHVFIEFVYTQENAIALKCIKCNDKGLKKISEESSDAFGYNTTRHEDAYIKGKKK